MHHQPEDAKEASIENSHKLERIIYLLEGTGEETPGLVKVVNDLRDAMFGIQGKNGITQKVDIMWRIYIWLLCSMSAALGYWIKTMVESVSGKHP